MTQNHDGWDRAHIELFSKLRLLAHIDLRKDGIFELIGQGLKTNLTYKTLTLSYLLNPSSLLNVFFSVMDRHQVTDLKDKHDLWFTFGIRNSLRNFYYDF